MLFSVVPGLNLQPSVLCLGVAEHGSHISSDDSLAMLDEFAAAGGNFADTAHVYASWLPNGAGQSERALGRWLRSRRPRDFIVGTKGGHPDLASMEIPRLAPKDIARDVQESLERLQLDSVGLYWLHRDDPTVPVDEIMDALDEQVLAGRVGALGASNWISARIEDANQSAARRNRTGFCASQIGWSLAEVNPQVRGVGQTVQMDEQTLQWHRSSRFPQVAYSSQANGFFAHPLPAASESLTHTLTDKQKSLARSYLNPKNRARYQRAHKLGEQRNQSAHEIALAYVWSQSFPAVAVIGPRHRKQLDSSLRAADLRLTLDEIAFLEGVETRGS